VKKIKIAFFAEILIEEFDGASRTMFQILHRIPKEHFDFLFICGVGPDEIMGYPVVKVPAVTIPFNSTYKMAVPALAAGRIRAQVADFQPDVVHIATPSSLGSFALKYAQNAGIPVITIYHTHFVSYIAYYLRALPFLVAPVRGILSRFQTRFYNACQKVYIPSESIAAELVQDGLHSDLITIWRRGIRADLFHPNKRDTARLRQQTNTTNEPLVLFASRLVWEKNLQALIDVYRLSQERGLTWHFVVVGDGVAADACKRAMPKATFLGTLDHHALAQVYASADVFMFPSISESYGNVVVEAMASGLPVVIADGGGSRDFINQGVNGFRCTHDAPEAYMQHIEQILTDSALHGRLSVNARQYAESFSWEALVQQYFGDVRTLAQEQTTKS
jgi:glycosyltransferase involved in cell wall biosynthesis